MNDLTITNVKYVEGYKLEIQFSDDKIQVVDFAPFLNSSRHPDVRKYLDLDLFKQYQIIDGDLDWNDFELTLPIWDLYTGKILKSAEPDIEEAS